MLDIDNVTLPKQLRTVPYSRAHAAYARTLLPPEFAQVGCVWCASASAGVALRKLKLHLWFLLDLPVTAVQLRNWLPKDPHNAFDRAVFKSVQPHYTAAPLGSKSVYSGKRCGLLAGADCVVVPLNKLADGNAVDVGAAIAPRGEGAPDLSARELAKIKKACLAAADATLRDDTIHEGYHKAYVIGTNLGPWVASKFWGDVELGHKSWKAAAANLATTWGVLVEALPGTSQPLSVYVDRVMQGIAWAVGEQRDRLNKRSSVAGAQRSLAAAARVHAGRANAVELVAAEQGCAPATAAAALAELCDWEAGLKFLGKHKDEIAATSGNISQVFRLHPDFMQTFRFNLRSQKMELAKSNALKAVEGPIEPDALKGVLVDWLVQLGCTNVSFKQAYEAFKVIKPSIDHYDPFLELLAPELALSRKQAKAELLSRNHAALNTWLVDYYGADNNKFVRAVSERTLLSLIARAVQPGCKAENMLVLVGKGGLGKSTAIETLANVVHEGYAEVAGVFDRDAAMVMRTSLISEMSEMHALRKNSSEATKAMLSRAVDKYRAPYAEEIATHPRRSIIIGTTNAEDFLVEQDRRFWPVLVTRSHRMLPAQALELLRLAALAYRAAKRPQWWLPEDMHAEQQAATSEFVERDEVLERDVQTFVTDKDSITMHEVAHKLFPENPTNRRTQYCIGRVLRQLGWEKHVKRDANGVQFKAWKRGATL